jgi:hypothetical protein
MRLSSPRKEKEEAYPKLSNTDYSLVDTPSGCFLFGHVFALFGFTIIARSRLPMLPALGVHPDLVRIQGDSGQRNTNFLPEIENTACGAFLHSGRSSY